MGIWGTCTKNPKKSKGKKKKKKKGRKTSLNWLYAFIAHSPALSGPCGGRHDDDVSPFSSQHKAQLHGGSLSRPVLSVRYLLRQRQSIGEVPFSSPTPASTGESSAHRIEVGCSVGEVGEERSGRRSTMELSQVSQCGHPTPFVVFSSKRKQNARKIREKNESAHDLLDFALRRALCVFVCRHPHSCDDANQTLE